MIMAADTRPAPSALTVITFTIDEQICVMSVHDLLEIVRPHALMPLPVAQAGRAPENGIHVLGILDYRGRAIPVMRLLISAQGAIPGTEPGPPDLFSPVLVLGQPHDTEGRVSKMCALAVRRVHAVAEIDQRTIQPPREVGLAEQPGVSGICRMGDRLAYVIDGASLIGTPTELTA
jgi:chemotaxis signal transduction protein